MHNPSTSLPSDQKNTLLANYQADIQTGKLQPDPAQKQIVTLLQTLLNDILSLENPSDSSISIFKKLFTHQTPGTPLKGIYIWGDVGRGKTFLVNYFYHLLPIEKKIRLHFYRFMQLIHEELETLKHESDPLKAVALKFASKARVLCLDEMLVNDITDAMLLGRLFQYLIKQKVILVITSNLPPGELYKDGLQRARFLPAIKLLEQHTQIVKLEGELDYRLQKIENNPVYLDANDSHPEQLLEQAFASLAGIELHKNRTDIIINQRRIPVIRWADDIVWLHFNALCNTPRSAEDYRQIGTFFKTVLISQIPVMDETMNDAARRFITLIDTLYDLHVNLIVSAAAEPELLYKGDKLVYEFQRTVSRLREMQTRKYIGQ